MKLDFEQMTAKAKENEERQNAEFKAALDNQSERSKARQEAIAELMNKALQRHGEEADAEALAKADEIGRKAREDFLKEYERESGHFVEEKTVAKQEAYKGFLKSLFGE